MLFNRQVYSSWKRRHSVARAEPLYLPNWSPNADFTEDVSRRVPYRSKARMIWSDDDGEEVDEGEGMVVEALLPILSSFFP